MSGAIESSLRDTILANGLQIISGYHQRQQKLSRRDDRIAPDIPIPNEVRRGVWGELWERTIFYRTALYLWNWVDIANYLFGSSWKVFTPVDLVDERNEHFVI